MSTRIVKLLTMFCSVFPLSVLLALPSEAFSGARSFANRQLIADGNIAEHWKRYASATVLFASNEGVESQGEEDEDDPLLSDQREGMADAFAALDGLTADDFDDLKPSSSLSDAGVTSTNNNMEQSAKVFMEMQSELSSRGEEGVYDDILGDLSGDSDDLMPSSAVPDDDITELGNALEESSVLSNIDGLGSGESSSATLTTADVANDVLTQDVESSLSMDDFMSKAVTEALTEVAAAEDLSGENASPEDAGEKKDMSIAAEQLLEDEQLRKEIEDIFDRAGEKLKLEVAAMKKEQEAVTKVASDQGFEYIESEKQRLSEAEESVSRLIQTVADRTDEVQKAMEELERAKNEAGDGSGSGIEKTALDLKQGGVSCVMSVLFCVPLKIEI